MPAPTDFQRAMKAVLPHAGSFVYLTPYMVVAGGKETVAAAMWAPVVPNAPVCLATVGAAKHMAKPPEIAHDKSAATELGALLRTIPRKEDAQPVDAVPLRLHLFARFTKGLPTSHGIVRLLAGGTSLRYTRPLRVEYEDWFVGGIAGEALTR